MCSVGLFFDSDSDSGDEKEEQIALMRKKSLKRMLQSYRIG